MKKINAENLFKFAFYNSDTLSGAVKGVVLNCHGFTDQSRFTSSTEMARILGENGILYIFPYYNPWAWCNDLAVEYINDCLDALYEIYGLSKRETPFVCAGGSMGGMTSFMYSLLGNYKPCAVMADCPTCDLRASYVKGDMFFCAINEAYYHEDIEKELSRHNPIERVGDFLDVPYMIVTGGADAVIPLKTQTPLMEAMRKRGLDLTHLHVDGMQHCGLDAFPESLGKYAIFAVDAINREIMKKELH